MAYLYDTFTNFLSGLGISGRDKLTGYQYVKPIWTRQQLEAAFQSDWIARKAITIPPMDATREWRNWQAEADQIEKLEDTEKRLNIRLKLQQALIKARLYGGCCLLIGVDGDMAKELKPESIKKDSLKFVHVLAPHDVAISDLDRDISSEYYGQPTYYELTSREDQARSVRIHPSRMVRLLGLEAPDPMLNYGWGDPLMQVIHDAVASAGTVIQSIAALVQEAKFDVVKIPGLTEIFSTDEGTRRMLKRFSEANVAKSVVNGVLIDGDEEWQRIGANFLGMPEIMHEYLLIVAGAADVPATRFLGQSPKGLNATGESDLQNYYDRVAADQELRLTPALEKLDKAIQMSALGKIDDSIYYEWAPLWQVTDAERADISLKKAQATALDVNSGLIPFSALVKGKCNQLVEDGVYPGLDAAIQDAIDEMDQLPEAPPPTLGPPGGVPQLPPPGGGAPPGANGKFGQAPDKAGINRAPPTGDSYNENQSRGQPDNSGKFGPGGGPDREGESRKATAALAGKAATEVHSATPDQFVAARDKSTRQQFLSPHPAEELQGHTLLMNANGTVGISVAPDGDVQNVFNNGGPKGGAAHAMVAAIAAGGRTLDCYAGHLNKYYHQFGFEEDSRMKFNPDFAPSGWDFAKFDNPDIVFMSWRGWLGKGADDAIARVKTPVSSWEQPEKASKYVDDWDAAKAESRGNAAKDGGGKKPDSGAREAGGAKADKARSQSDHRAGQGHRRTLTDEVEHLLKRLKKANKQMRKLGDGMVSSGVWQEEQHPRVPKGEGGGGRFGTVGTGLSPKEKSEKALTALAVTETRARLAEEAKAKKGEKKAVTKADFDKANVRLQHGINEKAFIDRWNEKIGMDPAEFRESFLGGAEATMGLYMEGNKIVVSGDLKKGDRTIGTYTRHLDPDRKYAYSAYFEVYRQYQHSDVGKKMLAGNIATYEKLGIETVGVTANIDVGGYAWAKYGYVPTPQAWESLRSDMRRKINAGGGGRSGNEIEADEWDTMSPQRQEDTYRRWADDNRQEFVDSEISNWRESGDALQSSKVNLVSQFNDGEETEWAYDALEKLRDQRANADEPKPDFPFTDEDIVSAVEAEEYSSRYDNGDDDPSLSFNDESLNEAKLDPSQPQFPGWPPKEAAKLLTEEMRDDIIKALNKAFNDKAERMAEDIEPPDYITENVEDYMGEYWEGMRDRDRFRIAEDYGTALSEIEEDDEVASQMAPDERSAADKKLLELLDSRDPKTIWQVSDTARGKELLLNSTWAGKLNLKDPASYKRFKDYVAKKKG